MTGSPSRIPRLRRRCFRAALVRAAAVAAAPESSAAAASIPHSLTLACGALLGLILTGCAETGDFGRPQRSIWNDLILPAAGSVAAQARGEPVSRYIYTDDENEIRDRAWRFVMPAHERSWFEAAVANLVRTRVLPLDLRPADHRAYHRALMGGSFRSAASRYHRLSEDAAADLKLIGPFAAIATRVMAADRVRLRSLAHVRELDGADIHHAVARTAENRCLIGWVRYETLARIASYRYALEHLLIEAPQNEAIAAERWLAELEVHRDAVDAILGPPVPNILCAGADDVAVSVGPSVAGIDPVKKPLIVKD